MYTNDNKHKCIYIGVWWNTAFFCTSSYTSWYGAVTKSIPCFNFRHLSMKWYTPRNDWPGYPIWRLLHKCQNHLHLAVHRLLSAAHGRPPLTKQHESKKLRYPPQPNVAILHLEREHANISMFHISSCWFHNLWISLISSVQSISEQPFRPLDFSLSTDSSIFTTISYAVRFIAFKDPNKVLLACI